MNIYFVLGIVAVLGMSHWFAYDTGKDVEAKHQLELDAKKTTMVAEVKEAIAEGARQIGGEVNSSIAKIKVTHTTINRAIEREKETHYVLSDPNCAVPVSTVKLRNESRLDPDIDKRARQRSDSGLPELAPSPGGQVSPAR